MGKRFVIGLTDLPSQDAAQCIQAVTEEMVRLEMLFSANTPQSDIQRIQELAGVGPVDVSVDVFLLLQRAFRLATVTSGFLEPAQQNRVSQPLEYSIYQHLELHPLTRTVYLRKKGLRFQLEELAVAYTIDKAKEMLLKEGVLNGVIHTAGQMTAWGRQANGEPWTLGTANPAFAGHLFSYAAISNQAVATTGCRVQSLTPGRNVLDPAIQQVTVFSPCAELSYSLAQSLLRLGKDSGLKLINKMQQVKALILCADFRLHTSHNIHLI